MVGAPLTFLPYPAPLSHVQTVRWPCNHHPICRIYPKEILVRENTMQPRIDYRKYAQEPLQQLLAIEKYIAESGLEPKLIHLIKMRASQINGCAYCLDMHSIDARTAGESEQRLYTLEAWRETPFFSERERAALAWTEAVTLISQTHAPDDVYADMQKHFSEKEIVDLTLVAAMINLWNRVAISLRAVPGHYRPAKSTSAASS
jgi:AhpD family alkylhydroperoxidase